MPTNNHRSLQTKIGLQTAIIIITFGILATYFVYNQINKLLLSQIYTDNQLTSAIFADRTNQRLKVSHALIANLANVPLIQDYYQTKNPPTQEKNILNRLNEENYEHNFSAIYLLDQKGNTLVSTEPTFVNQNYSFRPYFQNSIQGKNYIDIAVGITSKQLGFYLSSPISVNNKIVGVVVGKLKTEPILHLMNIESIKNTTINHSIHLLDETGTIIISTDQKLILTPISNLDPYPKLKKLSQERYNNQNVTALEYQKSLESLTNHEQLDTKQNQTYSDTNEKLLTLTQVSDTPFYILLDTKLSPIQKSINQTSQTTSLIILVAALLATISIKIALSKKLKPLAELTQSALSVSQNNSDWQPPKITRDEIGELNIAFTNMVNKLINNKREIESQVSKRTSELTKLNSFMLDRELKMIELKNQITKLKKSSK